MNHDTRKAHTPPLHEKQQGLNGTEVLHVLVIFPEEWAPENSYVTFARKMILDAVQYEVDKVYA